MELTEDDAYNWYRYVQDGVRGGLKNMKTSWDSRSALSLVLTALSLSSAQQGSNIVDLIGQGIGREVSAAKHPIEESLVYVGSSQCKHVKRLVGVSYEQLTGEKEPDLNKLALFYNNRFKTATINITDAAGWLLQSRNSEPDKRLIIFSHGFTDKPQGDNFFNISRSFLQSHEISVLALDGSPLIRWLYLRSSTYVRFIGQKLAEVLAALVEHGQDPSLIHLIGHSLGSHISGFAGKTFEKITGKKIGRISGLDPAGPCFSHVDPEVRLKSTDADFVDVIHTDSGVFGIKEPLGHVDFFPNQGLTQPNCVLQSCSHSRCVPLYGESIINPEAFPAVKCKDWDAFKKGECEKEVVYMGYPTKPGTKGLYFLRTKGESPFGLGMEGTRYVNNEGIVKNLGNLFG
ncbi:pancreatic triacylglycerol lipase-like isoform X1 [Pieris napi]|uniref:pancreatic triacylglycerol lipase-like isoform X1 n=2 Tax=Pieris napi TaxID=78633 RepID=UPI001FB9DBC7|nr:pancreatic triacylglycerol lipase-like isoform X1 [Pieris napi]